MFETLETLPADPILSIGQAFEADPRPDKIGLSVGVYRDESGATPVLASVRAAELAMLEAQTTKSYIGQIGDPAFLDGIKGLVFGQSSGHEDRIRLVQTPGGCGAVRLGAELLFAARKTGAPRVWVSDPTWGNHLPLLGSAGLEVVTYPYYDVASATLTFDAMLETLGRAAPGDVVLLHGCCHNPTGADLDTAQWQAITELCQTRGLVPFVDLAYQGFGVGLAEDAAGIRGLVDACPEVVVAVSCSKNFGLYRERVGLLAICAEAAPAAEAALSHALVSARRSYTMAPYHGAGIVGTLLSAPTMKQAWETELGQMRARIQAMRSGLSAALAARLPDRDFSFIERQFGMFSFLGISAEQVARLRAEHAVYLLSSSRINLAGLNRASIEPCADAIAAVLTT